MEQRFLNNLIDSYQRAQEKLSTFPIQESKHWKAYNSVSRESYFDKNIKDLNFLENFRFNKS